MPEVIERTRARASVALDALVSLIGLRALIVAASFIGLGLLAATVLASPYKGDDLINMDIRQYGAATGQSLGQIIAHYNAFWVGDRARFFPGSLTWSYTVFWFTGSRIEYKLVLVVVLAAAITVTTLFAWTITRSRAVAAIVPLALIGTLQLRGWYDGIVSFAGLVPLTIALTIGATVIVLRSSRAVWWCVAGVLYFFALITYETVALFAPAMVAVVVVVTRSWRRSLALAIPALVAVVIAFVLRVVVPVVNVGSAYTVSLDPRAVLTTFAKQTLGSLPLSQWWLGSAYVHPLGLGLVLQCLVIVAIPVFLAARALAYQPTAVTRGRALLLAGSGLWMWLSSAALIAVTLRWQTDLKPGDAYLAVIYGYFGLAFIASGVWAIATSRLSAATTPRWQRAVWANGCAALIAVVAALTAAGNLRIVG